MKLFSIDKIFIFTGGLLLGFSAGFSFGKFINYKLMNQEHIILEQQINDKLTESEYLKRASNLLE